MKKKNERSLVITEKISYLITDADLHGDVDGADLSGDDRSIASDVQDGNDVHLDHDSIDSDREALNLVSNLHSVYILKKQTHAPVKTGLPLDNSRAHAMTYT